MRSSVRCFAMFIIAFMCGVHLSQVRFTEPSPLANNSPRQVVKGKHETTTAVDDLEVIKTRATELAGDNYVIIQLLTAGYLELTKNWVCNVRDFGILDKVLFIATDRAAEKGLVSFDSSLHVSYYSLSEDNTSFGFFTVEYIFYMVRRTKLILQLLQAGITLWLVESDAVWLKDPSERVSSMEGDIVVLNDMLLPETYYCGGFQFLRPTNATIAAWKKTHKRVEANTHKENVTELLHGGNEQAYLNWIARHTKGLKLTFLPQDEFLLGKLYTEPRDKYPNASVIHNNWVEGNGEKLRRAKSMGDWFLNKDGSACISSPR